MATSLSGFDPHLLALLSQLGGQQQESSRGEESDSSTPFGMEAGPGLELLRTLNAPQTPNFIGQPPSSPVQQVSGGGGMLPPSQMSRPPDLSIPGAHPIAFGAMPNSSLEPAVVQRVIQGDYGPGPDASSRRDAGDYPIESAAPKGGGFPDIQVQPMPPLINAFRDMPLQPMPGLVNGFQDTPVIQGYPQMSQMGMPGSPGVLAQAPSATLAGLTAPQIHAMLAGGQMPGMGELSQPPFSGLATPGGAGSRGASSGTGGGGQGGFGSQASRAAAVPAALGSAGLINTLARLAPGLLRQAGNLFGGGNLGPAGVVGGDPLGTGALTNTGGGDINRPIFGTTDESSAYPQDFPNEWEGGDTGIEPSMWDLGGSTDIGIEPSDWGLGDFFAGDPEAGLGGGSVDLSPLFSGDPEAGLGAASLGDFGNVADAGGGFDLSNLASGLDLGAALPFLGPALSLGSAAASPNPGASLLRSGTNIALNQGLRYLGNQTGATDWISGQLGDVGNTIGDWLSGIGGGAADVGAAGLGSATPSFGVLAGDVAPELGFDLAAALGGEGAAGAASGIGAGAGAGAGEIAGAAAGAGLGAGTAAILAPIAIAIMGGALQGHANSLFGYRGEGYSQAHAQARTAQQNQSMNLSNSVIGAADRVSRGEDVPGDVVGFLRQVAIPKSQANMGLFRAQDEGATENRGQWGQQQQQTLAGLRTLMDHYGDQLDAPTKFGLAQAINSRLPQGAEPIPLPDLTPEQVAALPWETQLYYQDQTDPGWRDRMAQQQMAWNA